MNERLEDPQLDDRLQELQVIAEIFPGRLATLLPELDQQGGKGRVEPSRHSLDCLAFQAEKLPQPFRTHGQGLLSRHSTTLNP